MITFFTTFRTYSRAEQNAVNSWLAIDPGNEVIVFTETMARNEIMATDRVSIRPVPSSHASGPPLLNGIFDEASKHSKHALLGYCNSDIILMPEFMNRARILSKIKQPFLAVSQRIDVTIDFTGDFGNAAGFEKLKQTIHAEGKLHPPMGSDVFVFPKNQYTLQNMPPLVVGRPAWDLWMIYDARARFNRLIDLTGHTPAVVHQDHVFNYQSTNPAHQVNFQYLPPRDVHTFVLSFCNYAWREQRIKPIAVKNKDMKRIRWEMSFAKRGLSYAAWWMLWKLNVAKRKIQSLL